MGAIISLFFVYFRLFKQTLQFLQQINVKECPSSWDSNPLPLDHEFPPTTTRPGGLLVFGKQVFCLVKCRSILA